MSTGIGIAFATVTIVLIGAAVIISLALKQRSRDQWRERLRDTSQEVWRAPHAAQVQPVSAPKQASFDKVWADRSRKGSAYVGVPESATLHLPHVSAGRPSSQQAPSAAEERATQVSPRTPSGRRIPHLKPVSGLAQPNPEVEFSYPKDGRSIA